VTVQTPHKVASDHDYRTDRIPSYFQQNGEGLTLVPAVFPFDLNGIQKGCRLEHKFWSLGRTHARIHVAKAEDAHVAFRVRYPADYPHRYACPKDPLLESDARAASVVEIIRYDAKCWWPIKSGDAKARYATLTLSEALGQLEHGDRDILNSRGLDLVKPLPPMRSVSESSEGHKEAVAQRAVSENMLIWSDRIYARGGEPAYAMIDYGGGGVTEIIR
jgi:hypothetical protein